MTRLAVLKTIAGLLYHVTPTEVQCQKKTEYDRGPRRNRDEPQPQVPIGRGNACNANANANVPVM
jgi:hypothetical protein